nr:hypothetical protein CPGR_02393 [Mycolicibacter nonchromogenicus]
MPVASETVATTACAVTNEAPMVISGSTMVTGLR